MKLYYSPGACSMAVHLTLNEIDANSEFVKVDLKGKKTENGDDYWAINPKGQVPALDVNGDILTEVGAILQYLADSHPEAKLAPAAPSIERAKLNSLLNWTASEFHKVFSPLFNPVASDELKTNAINTIDLRLKYLENLLSDGREFVAGDGFTIVDAYVFTVLGWTRYVNISLENFPNIGAYLGRVSNRPSVGKTLKEEGLI